MVWLVFGLAKGSSDKHAREWTIFVVDVGFFFSFFSFLAVHAVMGLDTIPLLHVHIEKMQMPLGSRDNTDAQAIMQVRRLRMLLSSCGPATCLSEINVDATGRWVITGLG